MVCIRDSKKGLSFDIQVVPNASRQGISGVQDGVLKIRVNAPPVEGAANEACIKLLAGELKLKKSQLEIFAGAKSKRKKVMVKDIAKAELETRIKDILE